jgi:hypothetical protein
MQAAIAAARAAPMQCCSKSHPGARSPCAHNCWRSAAIWRWWHAAGGIRTARGAASAGPDSTTARCAAAALLHAWRRNHPQRTAGKGRAGSVSRSQVKVNAVVAPPTTSRAPASTGSVRSTHTSQQPSSLCCACVRAWGCGWAQARSRHTAWHAYLMLDARHTHADGAHVGLHTTRHTHTHTKGEEPHDHDGEDPRQAQRQRSRRARPGACACRART